MVDMTSALAEAASSTNVSEHISSNATDSDNGTTATGGGCDGGLNLTCPEDLGCNSIVEIIIWSKSFLAFCRATLHRLLTTMQ